MARDDQQVNFRLPAELREKLKQASEESKRTLTAEIVARLEASFQPVETARPEETQKIIDKAIDKAVESTMNVLAKRGLLMYPPAKAKKNPP